MGADFNHFGAVQDDEWKNAWVLAIMPESVKGVDDLLDATWLGLTMAKREGS